MGNIIKFYLATGKYGGFSNFSRDSVFLKNNYWPTSEHYFQAQKFVGTKHEEEIRLAHKPMLAASMGRDRKRPLRKDWESVKDHVMREVLMAKFTQRKELKALLLGTGETLLVEHTSNDNYWGDGGDGSGKNMLGMLLMETREEIRKGNNRYVYEKSKGRYSI